MRKAFQSLRSDFGVYVGPIGLQRGGFGFHFYGLALYAYLELRIDADNVVLIYHDIGCHKAAETGLRNFYPVCTGRDRGYGVYPRVVSPNGARLVGRGLGNLNRRSRHGGAARVNDVPYHRTEENLCG